MLILGIESSCDETGVWRIYDTEAGGAACSRTPCIRKCSMHQEYGGVVPGTRLARPHPTRRSVTAQGAVPKAAVRSARSMPSPILKAPGLAGALLVGAAFAEALATALEHPKHSGPSPGRPSAFPHCSRAGRRRFPFIALARLRRPQPIDARHRLSVEYALARRNARRCSWRGLRQDRQAARVALSRGERPLQRWPSSGRPRRMQIPEADAQFG
jgi:hypothetical protein